MSKIIAFDLDDVICKRDTEEASVEKYKQCKPINNMIHIVNECYDQGYEIIIYTARGMKIFDGNKEKIYNELYDITYNHLIEWGIKFHKLIMGKINYDLLIDDKALKSEIINSFKDIELFLKIEQ